MQRGCGAAILFSFEGPPERKRLRLGSPDGKTLIVPFPTPPNPPTQMTDPDRRRLAQERILNAVNQLQRVHIAFAGSHTPPPDAG